MDIIANDVAGQTILENKNYMADIDRLIVKERDTTYN